MSEATIEIKYNQRQARNSMIAGLVFFVFGVSAYVIWETAVHFVVGMSVFYIGSSLYRQRKNYCEISGGILKKDFGGSIPLNEVLQTFIFTDEYVFKSSRRKITLVKAAMEPGSQPIIEKFILDLRSGKFRNVCAGITEMASS